MSKLLYSQSDPDVAALRYGHLGKTVDRVGCALVAIYNVMKYLGREQSFEAVLRDAQKLHMPWLFGAFGTKPWALKRYFKIKNVPFKQTNNCREWKSSLPGCRAAIVCTWNSKRRHGIHYYSVINKDGKLYALNRYSDFPEPTPFSPDDTDNKRFITGFTF